MRHLCVSLLTLGMTWTTLLMTSGVSAQSQTLHYNQGQLNQYVRAAQQLRKEFYNIAVDMAVRVTTIQTTMASLLVEVKNRKISGMAAAVDFAHSLRNISSYAQLRYEGQENGRALMCKLYRLRNRVRQSGQTEPLIAAMTSCAEELWAQLDDLNKQMICGALPSPANASECKGVTLQTAAAVVYGVSSYTNTQHKIFQTLKAAHFVHYTEDRSEATILMDGVYSVQYRVQMVYYAYTSTYLYIYDPAGTELHKIKFQWYRSCTPTLEVFELTAGSKVEVSNLLGWHSWYYVSASRYMGGRPYASQLHIQYLSPSS